MSLLQVTTSKECASLEIDGAILVVGIPTSLKELKLEESPVAFLLTHSTFDRDVEWPECPTYATLPVAGFASLASIERRKTTIFSVETDMRTFSHSITGLRYYQPTPLQGFQQ
jgi:hypothetical protein